MKRSQLNRACHCASLAIACVAVLSYLPVTEVQAANVGATILPSAEKPLVNLRSRQTLQVSYTGPADAVAALRMGTANPTALAAADFDADGAMDVVAGYSTGGGGLLALLRGNPDAYAPKDLSLYKKAMLGSVPSTFLTKASVIALPASPDLLVTGDFNRDGHVDVLVAARGGALYFLAGDGHGNLLAPEPVPLAGQVMAMAASADAHVAVSLDGAKGPQLAILTPGAAGLAAGTTYRLPARGDAVAWGNLGGGADLAVGAGAQVVMIYHALAASAQTETVSVPFQVAGLVLGDFIWDRDGRTEISVLAHDGTLHILQHGKLDTRPLTATDIPGRRAALRTKSKAPTNPTSLGEWSIAKQLPQALFAPAGPIAPSAFSSPRLAAARTHDLMVLDARRSELSILDTSGQAASARAAVSFSAAPIAALALPQKINASRDIIVLTSSQSTPTLITAGGGDPTFVPTTTADEDDAGACTDSSVTSGTGPDGVLSLREAVCEANNNAPASSTINLGAGTYDLKDIETGELQVDTSGMGYSLSIIGTGTASDTIIEQTDGIDRLIEGDFALAGGNPITIENVTLTGGHCTNTTTNDCIYGGGAVLTGGATGDDFIVTNVVVSNNSVAANNVDFGGGLNSAGSNFTITNSSFSGNSTDGPGGGLYYTDYPPTVEGTVTVTNSSFAGNTAGLNGGGLEAELDTGYPLSVTGSTFTLNQATGSNRPGGGIFVEQDDLTATTATVTNSRFVGNTAPNGGGGVAVQTETIANLENNWWGCNAGPGNPGCDSVEIETSGSYTPVLVLGISASATQLGTNGTSTLTADLTHNSDGTGGFSVPDGTGVAFGGTLGTDNPTSATTTSGQATSTYTAGGATGAGSGTATVDNQLVSVALTIGQPPAITSPNNTTFTVGASGTFTVTTSGLPAASLSESGALPGGVTFANNGNGTGTLSGTAAAGTHGVYSITFTAQNGFTPNATQMFTLTVDQAHFTVSPTSVAFGSQQKHTASEPMPVTVTNTGAVPLPIASITLSGTNPGQFSQTPTCGPTVAVGSSCTINVVFMPTTTGSMTATLAVKISGAGMQSVALSGTGAATPYTVSPSSLAFGSVAIHTASEPMPVTVTNISAAVLPITSITFSGTNAGQFSHTSTCGSSLAVGSDCTINVVFKPTSTGSKSATLNVKSSGAGTKTVALSGTGT